ncbi:MAG: class I SAM-dependent methyltransferase [Thermaerobacter sp.]|nr:class I SAM-dependent methyltransferase [Thermaerobacter sp.]
MVTQGPGTADAQGRLVALVDGWLDDPATVETVRRSLEAGVVLDTWMAGRSEESFETEALSVIEAEVTALTREVWGKVFSGYRLSEPYLATAFHELLSSMAMFQAHREKGNLQVGEREAALAVRRLRSFAAAEPGGLGAVLGLYWLITTYENYGALVHYGRIMEEDFRFGTFHRPWIRNTLDEELYLAELLGHVEGRHPCPEGACVLLTPEGRAVYARVRRVLERAGEIAWRMQQQHLALFNEFSDYDELFNRVGPTAAAETQRFLDWAGLTPGMAVLELGCGTGRVTINCGLYRRVLPGGTVVATDPSAGMLAEAQAKARRAGLPNVSFCRAPAEELPFHDAAFDAVVGMAFLHFTDASRAVREMVRVVRPGGTVALGVGLKSEGAMMPVLPLWFEPIFRLARSRGLSAAPVGNLPGEAEELLREAGFAEVETMPMEFPLVAADAVSFVRLMLQGPGVFQEALEPLPYAERARLVEELEEAGREICEGTALAERTWWMRGEFVRARVPTPG